MRTGAAWDEYLNVNYKVVGGVLKNDAWSGDFYVPVLGGDASLSNYTTGVTPAPNAAALAAAAEYGIVSVGSSGYIDLGPKVGALLRKPEWTIEFFVRVNADSNTMLSFANDNNINTNTAASWRGTLQFHNANMYFTALRNGAVGNGSVTGNGGLLGTNPNGSQGVFTGGSLGIATRTNQWIHMALIKRTNGTVRIMRNYGRAQNAVDTSYSMITDATSTFGSGDEELEDLRFGYLGKSVLSAVPTGVATNQANGTRGWYYGFKAYSKAVPLTGDGDVAYPNQGNATSPGTLRGDKKAMNDAFGFNNDD
jgi:hypothetical protein